MEIRVNSWHIMPTSRLRGSRGAFCIRRFTEKDRSPIRFLAVDTDRCFSQSADTPPGHPFSASFRSSCFDIFALWRAFSSGFERVFSFLFVVLALLLMFACAKVLLLSGPSLEVLLLLSAFYAGRAVFTAFATGDSPFFLAVSMISQTLLVMTHSVNSHKASMRQPC